MSLILDATAIRNENDLFAESIDELAEPIEGAASDSADLPIDVILCYPLAVPPADCETHVLILIQRNPYNQTYYSGFRIQRKYETSPYEQTSEEVPSIDDGVGYTNAGDAVTDGAECVTDWLARHSDDTDEKAGAAIGYIEAWLETFDASTVEISQLVPVGEYDEQESIAEGTPADEPAATTVPAVPVVSGNESQFFEDEENRLRKLVSDFAMTHDRLKEAVKANRKAMDAATNELQAHLSYKSVGLPVFDGDKHNDELVRTEAADVPPAPDVLPDGPWQDVTTEQLGIDPKLCILLREQNGIATLGQISDFCKTYELTDLKKIGKAKAQKIEEAMDAYWKVNPPSDSDSDPTLDSRNAEVKPNN